MTSPAPASSNPFEAAIQEMVLDTPAPGKHCARSAFRHLRKAALLANIDPEMAAFRAITAEEEAASAVFHAIRRRRYVGANKLNPRDHLQKNALHPFCAAVGRLFAVADETMKLRPQALIVGGGAQRRLNVRFRTEGLGLGDLFASPHPPLNFAISADHGPLHDFKEHLQQIAVESKSGSILEHLRTRANMRNELLYASSAGVPSVQLSDFICHQQAHVKAFIVIYLLIDPYAEHQLFVSQAVLAFLKMLDRLPSDLSF